MAPLIADSIPAGQIVNKTVAIPATSLAILTLVSTDAHLSLVDPGGTPITVADTSMTSGISYFVSSDLGLEGFEIAGPMPGTWTMRINTTASSAGQKVAGIVEYPSASSVALSVDPSLLYPGDAMHVRGLIASSGILRTDVTWNCNVLGPGGTSTELTLYDDGTHGACTVTALPAAKSTALVPSMVSARRSRISTVTPIAALVLMLCTVA